MSKLSDWLKKHGIPDDLVAEAEGIAAEETQGAVDKEVAGLKTKNTELLGKLAKHSDDIESNPKYILLQTELEEAKGNVTKAQADLAAAKTAQSKAEKERDEKVKASEKTVADLLIDGGLTAALAEGTPAHNIKALKALHAPSFGVEYIDGKPRAVASVKDKDGKERKLEPSDYLKEWFATDEGKNFAKAPGSSGGGAPGSGGGNAATGKAARFKELMGKKDEEMTPRDKQELVTLANDPEATK